MTKIPCTKLSVRADSVERNDYLLCTYFGFVHVASVRVRDGIAYLRDRHGQDHMYAAGQSVDIARPDNASSPVQDDSMPDFSEIEDNDEDLRE